MLALYRSGRQADALEAYRAGRSLLVEELAIEPQRRHEISDYLLGQQQAVADRLRTRTLLSSTPVAREWAQTLASELMGIGGVELPEIPPAAPGSLAPSPAPAPPLTSTSASAAPTVGGIAASMPPATASARLAAPSEPYSLAQAASSAKPWEPSSARPSSRRGGALLLALIAAVVIVVVVIASSGGGSHKTAKTTSTVSTSTNASTGGSKEEAHFALQAPGKSRSVGNVQILSEDGKSGFYIQAEHIPATKHFFYAIWLYNSPTSALPLSKSPAVGKSHKLAGGALLPSNASSFKEILLTRETSSKPTHPGHVVLRGKLVLKN